VTSRTVTSRAAAPGADLLGAGLVALAATCFATLGPISRYAEAAGVGALALVTWRAALGTATVGALIAGQRLTGIGTVLALRSVPRRQLLLMSAAALANCTLNLAVFIAFLRISIALALLLFYLYPAYVALASVVFFGERLDRPRWVALALSLVGTVLVLVGAGGIGGGTDALGLGLALVAGLAQTVYVLLARHGFNSVPGPQAAMLTMGGAAVIYLVVAVLAGAGALVAPLASPEALWPVLAAGTIGAGLPTTAYVLGIRRLGAPRAAILATLEPVLGVTLAALLLGEQPTLLQLVGGALIIVAAVLLQVRGDAAAAHEATDLAVSRARTPTRRA
jgi:DME family drug/metabolite transporter